MSDLPTIPKQSSLEVDFRQVFEEEFVYVCRALQRLGVRAADVHDIAQEVFVALHSRFSEYDSGRARRPWIYGFVLRFAANYRRLARHGSEQLASVEQHSSSDNPELEARDLVLRALSTLDEEKRVAFVMHDLEGFQANEIAEAVGIPVNTVYSRIRLARQAFKSAVQGMSATLGDNS